MHPWDLGLKTAQVDDAIMWVDAQAVLHYESPWLVDRQALELAWLRHWQDDLRLIHSPQFSKNIIVKGRTYSPRTKTSVTSHVSTGFDGSLITTQSVRAVTSSIIPGTNETVSTSTSKDGTVNVTNSTSTGGGFSSAAGQAARQSGKEVHVIPIPAGTPPAIVNQILQTAWRQISMHEYMIQGSVDVTPETLGLGITSKINLSNSPYSRFNQAYWPREIHEIFDPESDGWKIEIHATSALPPVGTQ